VAAALNVLPDHNRHCISTGSIGAARRQNAWAVADTTVRKVFSMLCVSAPGFHAWICDCMLCTNTYAALQTHNARLQVVGVSFHVGSGCQDVSVYDEAIKRAHRWGPEAAWVIHP
jgi:uncharacterized protein CbrC (UPF0167 family)